MPARIEPQPTSHTPETTKVHLGGWWPSSHIQLSLLETFLRQGSSHSSETLKQYWQNLGVSKVVRTTGIISSITAKTESGIELYYSADGVYICSIEQASVSRAQETLGTFITHTWLPLLAELFAASSLVAQPHSTPVLKPTLVQIISDHPPLYEVSSSFGKTQALVSQPDLAILSTEDYLFIVSTDDMTEHGWIMAQWYVFTLAFEASQRESAAKHAELAQEIKGFTQHTSIGISRAESLQTKISHLLHQVSANEHSLQQSRHFASQRVATLTPIFASHELPQSPQHWQSEVEQASDYLVSEWHATKDYLEHFSLTINSVSTKASNYHLSLQRLITTFTATGVVYLWLNDKVFDDITLSWSGALLSLTVTALVVHLVLLLVYQAKRYTIGRKNKPTGKVKKKSK